MTADVILTTGAELRLDTEDEGEEPSFVAAHWLSLLTDMDYKFNGTGEPMSLGYLYADGRSYVAVLRPEHVVGVKVTP